MEKFLADIKQVKVDFDPFKGPVIERILPTTEAQREVYVASVMGVDANCAYNESVSLILTGKLDRASLEHALIDLVRRHEALRSVLNTNGTRTIVFDEVQLAIGYSDLHALDQEQRDKELKDIAHKDMTTPFDLVNGPLFRVSIMRMREDEYVLRLSGHHILIDGWSLGIMMAEISALYNAHKNGGVLKLPPAVPLSEYVLATIDFAKSTEHAAVEQYWMDLYKGPLPQLDLPVDRIRPKQKTYKGDRIDLEMAPDLVRGLKEVATRNGASFVTTLLTSFEILLYKLTGDSDIVVGLPAAGQSDLDMKHLVGHCVNLLALHSRIDEERPFAEHLKARRTGVLDAFDNQKYTFGTLLRKLRVPRQPGRIPLAPVVFNIDMNMDDGVAFDGLVHRFESNPRAFENFELFLNATGKDDHLVLEWSYNTDLFDAATIRGWMDQFSELVKQINRSAASPIAELINDLANEHKGEAPKAEWKGIETEIPLNRNIGQLFDEVVSKYGERTAVVLDKESLTYAALQARVNTLTRTLIAAGVKPGDPVGLCTERCTDMVASMIAIMRCGAAYVPFDPSYPAERLAFMFKDTSVNVLLTQRPLKEALPAHNARTLFLEDIVNTDTVATTSIGDVNSAAYIMYTSGSTGQPKGVIVPQRAIIRLVLNQNYLDFGPDIVFLQLSNVSFDASTLELWGALLNGGKLVLQPQQKPTLLEIVETIKQHNVTSVWFTAGLFNLMVDEHVEKLKGLKHILTGGDVLSVPHVARALRVVGPGVLINGYGPTENTTFTCCYVINDETSIRGGVPIGKALNNTTVHILNDEMTSVGIGEKGELYAGGDGVALGYWNRPDLTNERFVDDPFSKKPGAKMYRTGDLVRWLPDGNVEFIGRTDDQVKVRGFRVELGEIEIAIGAHPAVKDNVVMIRSDMPGAKQLVAYLVPKAIGDIEQAVDAQEDLITSVREHLRDSLPEHMVPTAFMVLPSFALNANGKVDKRALPVPELRSQTMHAQYVAPRDPQETALALIWGKLLGVKRIGVHDNFFDVGGHSLIGIQLLAQVEERFGISLALNSLFQAPTISTFSKLLGTSGANMKWKSLSAIQPEGDRIPFFCVNGDEANHFIPRYLGNDQPFYGFAHQGEDGAPIEFTTVGEIAKHFINEMKTVRPVGPFLLSGYSFGGIVAYEMACQLVAEGHEVPLLAMFDTFAPEEYVAIMRQEEKVYEPMKRVLMRQLVKREQNKGRIVTPKLRHFHIIDTYDKALQVYKPGSYSGPVTVFKAKKSPGALDMGWAKLVSGPLQVHELPGDHYSLIKDPEVKQLVKELAISIDLAVSKHAVEAV